MAVAAQHLRPGVAGDALRLPVEKEDPALHVVGDDAFLEVVQDLFEVVPVAHQGFEGKVRHSLVRFPRR